MDGEVQEQSGEQARRLVYVKQNDAIAEYRRVRSASAPALDGGPEAYVANFIAIEKGSPKIIVSFGGDKFRRYRGDGETTLISLPWPDGHSAKDIALRVKSIITTYYEIKCFQPTHVLCWKSSVLLAVAWMAARRQKARFVVSRHSRLPGAVDPPLRRMTAALTRMVIRRADAVICHGPYLKDETTAAGVPRNKIVEFNWSYERLVREGDADEEEMVLPDTRPVVLYVGRILQQKGVFDLLESGIELMDRDLDFQLVYAGDGPSYSRLKEWVDNSKHARRIVLLGRVDHNRLAPLFRRATVVCTPTNSHYPEGRCMAAIEGLVLGKPVIAPSFGPFLYLVRNRENGLLYRPDDRAALTAAIEEVLSDGQLYRRLLKGAAEAAEELKKPKRQFRSAVEQALNLGPRPVGSGVAKGYRR